MFSSDVAGMLFHSRMLYVNCLAAVAITLFFVLKDEKLEYFPTECDIIGCFHKQHYYFQAVSS